MNHTNFTCDSKNCPNSSIIRGFRYRCGECNNYDLCSDCFNAGIHGNHTFICIRKPSDRNAASSFLVSYAKPPLVGPAAISYNVDSFSSQSKIPSTSSSHGNKRPRYD